MIEQFNKELIDPNRYNAYTEESEKTGDIVHAI